MRLRLRKLIGTVVLILLVTVYAIFATAFASLYLGQASGWVHLAFFLFSGVLWVAPAAFLVRWMEGYSGRPR
ncbi:hypothetical protein GCM10011390_00890 [Aureimonas endophytica]|uniref:DUF2842 domain-containing protein n=1 Tax=Aureimonas endophytica TaxID=2027858 RepID=A0A916ZBK6_9HYPH|nr:DUF2842 domain-containing protein [Aureimonas endophytica]GGD86108.1 hypothetical protein GCM10011390_00890 [Aureimonas endophytica]